MVFDYKILPIESKSLESPEAIRGFSERRRTVSRKFRRDRRRSKVDRRKGVRDGVIVSLSSNKRNRRKGGDRRNVGGRRGGGQRSTGFFV